MDAEQKELKYSILSIYRTNVWGGRYMLAIKNYPTMEKLKYLDVYGHK